MIRTLRTLLGAVLALSLAGGVLVPIAAEAGDSPTLLRIGAGERLRDERITLGINKSVIIELGEDVRDVLVSNPAVADALVRSTRRVYLMAGAAPGQTNVFIFGEGGRQIANLELSVEIDTVDLQALIGKMVPGTDVTAASVNGSIVLAGRAPTPADAQRAFDIAVRYTGKPENVLNMISIAGKEQVHLKVTIAEVNRTIVKQLGIDLYASLSAGNFALEVLTDNPFSVIGNPLSENSAIPSFSSGKNTIAANIRALEQNGVFRTLAEPTLTAISGESANFLAGGEFPVPVSLDDGEIGIEFKQFGVSLAFTPVVLSAGRISLRVKTEVSDLSTNDAFSLSSGTTTLTLPSLEVRRAESTVELPSGGSLVIAGLIKDDLRQAINGVPGLMNLPVLGALFKSRDYQRQQTELVVLVTPFMVDPKPTGALTRPDQNYQPASDAATVFLNRLNRVYRIPGSAPPATSYHGRFGYIYE